MTDEGDRLTFDLRPRSAVQGGLVLLLAVLFVIVFVPPLRARFVADSFVHNGVSLERAVQSAYGRVDLTVIGPGQTADPGRPSVVLVVRDGIVLWVP